MCICVLYTHAKYQISCKKKICKLPYQTEMIIKKEYVCICNTILFFFCAVTTSVFILQAYMQLINFFCMFLSSIYVGVFFCKRCKFCICKYKLHFSRATAYDCLFQRFYFFVNKNWKIKVLLCINCINKMKDSVKDHWWHLCFSIMSCCLIGKNSLCE